MGIYDLTFYDIIKRNAHCFNKRDAWFDVDDSRTTTFLEYGKKVDLLACGLKKIGIKKGDRIGVLGKNSLRYFLLYGAAAALGAIIVPVNSRLTQDETGFNLNDCGCKLVFAGREYSQVIQDLKETLPSVENYFNLTHKDGDFLDFDSLLDNNGDFEPEEIRTKDGFVIIHTAAVTGRPRGALLSHANILCAGMLFNYFFNLTHKDIHLSLLPFFHIGGLLMAVSNFHAGAFNVNMSKFDAVEAVNLIEEKGVSNMMVFSPILSSILEQHEKTGKDISSLRFVSGIETAEAIEKYQEVTGGTFLSMYGQTETSCLTTIAPYNERPGSAGRMLPLADVRIVDDHDRPLPSGTVGEITMKGPMVFKGYWGLPEDTRYTFRNGRHHTGDLGRFDEDGFLWYAGRKPEKELIKPGGENVYPAEVEKIIMEHPAIEETVVIGVPDPKWKEGVKAVCRLKKEESIEPQELMDFVGERIAGYKKPRYVEFVPDFPRLENGLVDRVMVRELYGKG